MSDGCNVLVVEDSPGDIKLMEKAFEEYSDLCELHVVKDGTDAVNFLQQSGEYEQAVRPDIIILDLELPRMDGHEMLDELQGHEELEIIPVIVFTMSELSEDMVRSYLKGANACVTKPIDLEEFERFVELVVEFWVKRTELPRPEDLSLLDP